MNQKSKLIMLAGLALMASCSAPKYTYNFGHYRNGGSVAKAKSEAALSEQVANASMNESVQTEEPAYVSTSKETITTSQAEQVRKRVESLRPDAKQMVTQKASEHKAAKKEARREIKSALSEIKKSKTPLHDASAAEKGKSQLAALLLAIFLGGLGIHDFYLGRIGRGIAKIVLAIFGFLIVPLVVLAVWVLVDIILIAIGTEKPKGGEYSSTL